MARDVFWISVKMRFVRMVVFLGQGTHFKRQQVADVVIPRAGTWPGHGQIRKTIFCRKHVPGMGRMHFQGYHMLGP